MATLGKRPDLIFYNGGGNLGPIYADSFKKRLSAEAISLGIPIVVLPQSWSGIETALTGVTQWYAREAHSLRYAPKEAMLAPDLALAWQPDLELPAPRYGHRDYFRMDRESAGWSAKFGDSVGDPALLAKTADEYFLLAAECEGIRTDRLHFAIAGMIANRQVTLLRNSYFKNQAMYDLWLHGRGCRWEDTEEDPGGPTPTPKKVRPQAGKRIVIGIISAQCLEERREQCRQTWILDLAAYSDIDHVFVIGSTDIAAPERVDDVLHVPCPDDYDSLPQKVGWLAAWASETCGASYLFKCDDDTYVSVHRLAALELWDRDYVGSENRGYAQGGAGYFLSRRAAEIVARDLRRFKTGYEDELVGRVLAEAGIPLSKDWRFRMFCPPIDRPVPGNMIVTTHACRDDEMLAIHRGAQGIEGEPLADNTLFEVTAWTADYGMLGLNGEVGYPAGERRPVRCPSPAAAGAEREFISAHASSRVRIRCKASLRVSGFIDLSAAERPANPVTFIVDGNEIGTLTEASGRTRELVIPEGTHLLEAKVAGDNSHCHSVWAVLPG